MEKLTPVVMKSHYLSNSPGDRAGFAPDVAAMLVEQGAAAYAGAPPATPPAPAPAPEPTPASGWVEDQDPEPTPAPAEPAALPKSWLAGAPKPPKK